MTKKLIVDAEYDWDGSDVDPEEVKEAIEDSLNAHVTITPMEEEELAEPGFVRLPAKHQQMYMDAELEYAVLLIRAAYPLAEAMVGIGSSARAVVPDLKEFLERHGGVEWPKSTT
jgi:hypothetical protein